MMATVIICSAGSNLRRDKPGCPVCKIADAPIVTDWPTTPYYGPTSTCTACGDSWGDGRLQERPFRRGWRQKAIAEAVAEWEAACECPLDRDSDLYVTPCVHRRAA